MRIILSVRRIILSLACLPFALSLRASVPAASSAARFTQSSASMSLDRNLSSGRQKPPLTAAPAGNISFYIEFYGNETASTKAQRKPGLFHRLTSALKRTVQKVNLIPN